MQNASGLIFDRVIFYKHTDANFYSAWPFVFGRTIAGLPQVRDAATTIGLALFFAQMYALVILPDYDGHTDFWDADVLHCRFRWASRVRQLYNLHIDPACVRSSDEPTNGSFCDDCKRI